MENSPVSSQSDLTKKFRDRLQKALHSALKKQNNTLIVAPTSLGKTYEIASTKWSQISGIAETEDDPGTPIIHVSPTQETRDNAYAVSEMHDCNPHILKGREEACPIANGDHDQTHQLPSGEPVSQWINRKCDVQGIPFSEAHNELETQIGSLPCSSDSGCTGASQWKPLLEGDPEQFDIIHVTPNFVYNTELIADRHVVFDEKPEYIQNITEQPRYKNELGRVITGQTIRKSVTAFLKRANTTDANASWEDLISAVKRDDQQTLSTIRHIVDDAEVGSQWYLDKSGVNIDSRRYIDAILNAEPAGNGFIAGESTLSQESDESETGDRARIKPKISIVINDENSVKLLHEPPNLEAARTVIGLDAHPTVRLWKASTVQDLTVDNLGLSTEELREWRQTERGLSVIQVGDATRSYTSGWAGDSIEARKRTKRRAGALIREIRSQHGGSFRTAISAKSISDDVIELMKEAGIAEPEVLYYGNLRSRNNFRNETVGLLFGCIGMGDTNILAQMALLGLEAEPVRVKNQNGEEVRETGRTFTGPDSEAAIEILKSVREMEVAQGIGRYAREAQNKDSEATVYVWTDAIPPELLDHTVAGINRIVIGKERQILEHLSRCSDQKTVLQLRDEVIDKHSLENLSKQTVQNALDNERLSGSISVSKGTGANGAYEYTLDSDEEGAELVSEVDIETIDA